MNEEPKYRGFTVVLGDEFLEMFSSKKQLKRRTPENGINREEFIAKLAKEFIGANVESKEQVIANLANFSYDPINYEYMKKASVLPIFLGTLRHSSESLVLHSTAGICNLSSTSDFHPLILQPGSLKDLKVLLNSNDTHCDTKLNILTTFYLILTLNLQAREVICSPDLVSAVRDLRSTSCRNLGTLATLFIQDFATRTEEIRR